MLTTLHKCSIIATENSGWIKRMKKLKWYLLTSHTTKFSPNHPATQQLTSWFCCSIDRSAYQIMGSTFPTSPISDDPKHPNVLENYNYRPHLLGCYSMLGPSDGRNFFNVTGKQGIPQVNNFNH